MVLLLSSQLGLTVSSSADVVAVQTVARETPSNVRWIRKPCHISRTKHTHASLDLSGFSHTIQTSVSEKILAVMTGLALVCEGWRVVLLKEVGLFRCEPCLLWSEGGSGWVWPGKGAGDAISSEGCRDVYIVIRSQKREREYG
jgi:hypothetical protein